MSRVKNGYAVPHFQVVLGGQWAENAGSYGLAIGAIPSKRIPEVVDRMTTRFVAERQGGETFQSFIKRIGKAECKKMLDDLTVVPPHDVDSSFYQDWGDAREYTVGDLGEGECAGEVVSPTEFALTACEREVFEAQLKLEAGRLRRRRRRLMSRCCMAHWRWCALRIRGSRRSATQFLAKFRELFYDTQIFWDPFTGGKFAHYFFDAHEKCGIHVRQRKGAHLIEEAQLFIEGCHTCHALCWKNKPMAIRA